MGPTDADVEARLAKIKGSFPTTTPFKRALPRSDSPSKLSVPRPSSASKSPAFSESVQASKEFLTRGQREKKLAAFFSSRLI
jgi:hypothetical protein